MKKTTLKKTMVLMLLIMLTGVTPVFAKTNTEAGATSTMVIVSGSGEQVTQFKGGKMNWHEVFDVPDYLYHSEGALISWWNIEVQDAMWISSAEQVTSGSDNTWYIYKLTFDIPGDVVSASMVMTADNAYMLHVNGKLIGRDGKLYQPAPDVDPLNWETLETYDLTKTLREGHNKMTVYVRNYEMAEGTWLDNPTGLIFRIDISYVV